MAEAKPHIETFKISLPPNEILINVVHALNGHVDDLTREVDAYTTCNKAISHVQSLLENHDQPIRLMPTRTRREKEKLKELAKAINSPNQPVGPLRVHNALPASQLPTPKRATLEERKILKEILLKEAAMKKPFVMAHATLLDQRLPLISADIKLNAIDADENDPTVEIRRDDCLWDTCAYTCSISADLVADHNPSFLDLDVHEVYRGHKGLQVDAVVSLSNQVFHISTIFFVLPKSEIPNQRSGIILGQHGFMDRIMVETIPRSILMARGEEIEETIWGQLRIKAKMDLFEGLEEYN